MVCRWPDPDSEKVQFQVKVPNLGQIFVTKMSGVPNLGSQKRWSQLVGQLLDVRRLHSGLRPRPISQPRAWFAHMRAGFASAHSLRRRPGRGMKGKIIKKHLPTLKHGQKVPTKFPNTSAPFAAKDSTRASSFGIIEGIITQSMS